MLGTLASSIEDLKLTSSNPQPHNAISRGIQSEGYTTTRELLWADNKSAAKLNFCSDI